PALTAQVLRLVHSAGFMSRRKNPDLEESIKILGLEELSALLLVTAGRAILVDSYQLKEMETIWESSSRISYYSTRLAERARLRGTDAGIAGLLTELGRIVLIAVSEH